MGITIDDVEPIVSFIQKVGVPTEYGRVAVDLIAVGSLLHGRVVVDKTQLDLFAAQLYHASPDLYAAFMEAFPTADAGVFVGP